MAKKVENWMTEEEQKETLEKIMKEITNMLIKIIVRSEEIKAEEKTIYSEYMQKYYKKSVELNYDTIEMSMLFKIIIGLVNKDKQFNIIDIKDKSETYEFFIKEYSTYNPSEIYVEKIKELIERLKEENITKEEYKKYDYIIRNLNYIYDFQEMEQIRNLLIEKGKKFNTKSIALNAETEMYIAKNTFLETEDKRENELDKIISYYETQLQRSAREINNNGAIMHLIKEARLEKLPKEDSEKIMNILNERNFNKEIPDMEKYEINIRTMKKLKEKDFESFFNDISEIRLHKGKVPQKYIDYILKQVILSNIDEQQYISEIQRALEDFAENELEQKGIKDVSVSIVQPEILGQINAIGVFDEKTKKIMFSKIRFEDIGMIKKIEKILHECEVAQISDDISKLKINYKNYLILKEKIISDIYPEYYSENYQYMFQEIEARKQAYIRRRQILQRLDFSEEEIMNMDADEVQKQIDKCNIEENKGYNKTFNGKKGINQIFIDALQKNTEILEKYPIFNNQFENYENIIEARTTVNKETER